MNFRRSHKPPSARSTSTSRRTTSRSTAAFPSWYWSFVAYSEYAQLLPPSCHAGHRTRKQHTRKQPPRAATALLSPRRLSPGRALSGSPMALCRRSAALRLGCNAVTCTGRSGVGTSARRPLTPLSPQQHLTPRYSAHERARCHERAPCRRLLRSQPTHRRPPPPPPPPPLAVAIAAAALAPRRSAFTSSSTPHADEPVAHLAPRGARSRATRSTGANLAAPRSDGPGGRIR